MCLGDHFRQSLATFGVPQFGHSWTSDELVASRKGWNLPFGAVIGRVNVEACISTDDIRSGSEPGLSIAEGKLVLSCREMAFGDYSEGRFAILCSDPVLFANPIPYRGFQGLFEVPEALIDQSKILTDEQAQRAYDEAESVPITEESVKQIVEYATHQRSQCPGYGPNFTGQPCCDRAGEYNGFGSDGPYLFHCTQPGGCRCHD